MDAGAKHESTYQLFCFEQEHAAAPVVLLRPVCGFVTIRHLETVIHQIGTAESLALNIHRILVDAVQLVYLIHLVGIEACHLHQGQMLVLE